MNETESMKRIQVALSRDGVRLFRNNVGQAYQGHAMFPTPRRVIIDDFRVVHFGLCPGSSDLIGWKTVTVTPEMIGQEVAVFCAVEVKNPRRGKATELQQNFITVLSDHGGIAGVARTVPEATKLLRIT